MYSESGGGKTTLFIVVFFLCVISVLSGYFYYAMGSSEAEAQKKVAEIQAKAAREMADAKSAAEKDKIASEAAMQAAKAKLQAESAANASKNKLQNEALNKSKAKLKSDLAAAAKAIKEANALKLTANKAKADADKKAAEATSAIQKAQKSGQENEKKLAAEKKKLATQAQNKVNEANKKATQAIEAAKKEAQAVIELKKRLDSAETKLKQGAVASATVQGQQVRLEKATAVQGQLVRLEKATAVQGEALQKPKGDKVPVKISSFVFMRAGGYGKNKRYKIVEAPCYSYTCRENAASRTLQLVRFKGKGPDQFLIQDSTGRLCRWDGVKGGTNNLFACDLNNVSLEEAYDKKAVFTGKRMPANFAAPPGINIDKIRNEIVHLPGVKQDGGLRYCAHSRFSNAFRCDYDQPSAGNMFRITAIR